MLFTCTHYDIREATRLRLHVFTTATVYAQNRTAEQLIKAEYEKQQSSSLKKAIEKETSGALEKALVALLSPSITAYTAQALNQAFDGVGVVSSCGSVLIYTSHNVQGMHTAVSVCACSYTAAAFRTGLQLLVSIRYCCIDTLFIHAGYTYCHLTMYAIQCCTCILTTTSNYLPTYTTVSDCCSSYTNVMYRTRTESAVCWEALTSR
jgi:Annexin